MLTMGWAGSVGGFAERLVLGGFLNSSLYAHVRCYRYRFLFLIYFFLFFFFVHFGLRIFVILVILFSENSVGFAVNLELGHP